MTKIIRSEKEIIITDFNAEELKTAIGHIMLDLRDNWGWDYVERIEIIEDCLEILLQNDSENKEFVLALELCKSAKNDDFIDGRVFRNDELYGYSSDEGETERVHRFLEDCLLDPECNNFNLS